MRNTFGYILGFLVFVAGIPALMGWVRAILAYKESVPRYLLK